MHTISSTVMIYVLWAWHSLCIIWKLFHIVICVILHPFGLFFLIVSVSLLCEKVGSRSSLCQASHAASPRCSTWHTQTGSRDVISCPRCFDGASQASRLSAGGAVLSLPFCPTKHTQLSDSMVADVPNPPPDRLLEHR